ncbi:MAG TPA: DUF2911 domain-containing protein [Gemmatimonas sp.]|nr:DUF2911 domain-containing protein [Gemmatimonas sp.]
MISAIGIVAGFASPLAAQSALLVYKLGTDTLAVEQYTRTGNKLSGEMVQRAGAAVVRVSYDMTLGAGGRPTAATITRMQPDGTPIPNAPLSARFAITRDSIVREVAWKDSTQRRAFAARGAVVNFPTYVYGPTEILATLKRAGNAMDSVPAVGFTGNIGFAGVTAAGSDSLRLRGGAYPMVLLFDASNRLQRVDGAGTTNKLVAIRAANRVDMATIARAMKPTGLLSARDVARAGFGSGGMVLVDYGRPLVRERTVWGGTLVPFDSVWRTGANDATHLFTTRTLTMGAVTVPPGMYTLWIQHTRTGTSLIVNSQSGQWGTIYDQARDVGRVPLTMTATPSPVEEFTITVQAAGANRGTMRFAWGPSVGSVDFGVTTPR